MKIRDKILLYFSFTTIVLLGGALITIFILFSAYREEEFQQRQNAKIKQTLIFLNTYRDFGKELASVMDELTINDFYDEKMLVFNADKKLIFSSIDDLPISNYKDILEQLSPTETWLETKVENYDIVGVYIQVENRYYYAISKAYDEAGYSKIYFMRNLLIGIFVFIALTIVIISIFLSNRIAKPIVLLSNKLSSFDVNAFENRLLEIDTTTKELQQLTQRFNMLLKKTNEAFLFQKHAVNHISHELKTPIAILVTELEGLKNIEEITKVHIELDNQIKAAKSLGDIINTLLEIAKYETGQEVKLSSIRIDELVFDTMAELNSLYPEHIFNVKYNRDFDTEEQLQIFGNEVLLKQAFLNLLENSVTYGDDNSTTITFDFFEENQKLSICISNTGENIAPEEKKYLFDYFFRGANSKGRAGFGLGLVLTKKIILLNNGTIGYSSKTKGLNVFEVVLPLS